MHDRVETYIHGGIDEDTMVFGDTTLRFGAKKPAVVNRKFVPMLMEFRDHPNGEKYTELKLGFDSEWHLTGSIVGITPTWVIAILDAAKSKDGVVDIGEWKSGEPKPTHKNQRELYALAGLRRWMGCEEVRVTTYYLEDTAPPARLTVKPTAEEKLKDLWRGRVEEMTSDKLCSPRPGDYCRWMCDFAKSKGGPCEFGA